jgi:hypothetical protein
MSNTTRRSNAQASKQDNFNRFAWRDDVFADAEILAAPKCLAFGIAQFINCETGEATVTTRKLAKVCGFSQAWVRKTVPLLAAAGWCSVQVGRQGSGPDCTSRYKMNPTREHTGCSLPDADREHFSPLREHFSPEREHPVCSEPLNHLTTVVRGAPSAPPTVQVDKQELPTEISARERAYSTTAGVYENSPSTVTEDNLCRDIFFKILDRGEDPEQIISAAENCGEHPEPLIDFLRNERWKER